MKRTKMDTVCLNIYEFVRALQNGSCSDDTLKRLTQTFKSDLNKSECS